MIFFDTNVLVYRFDYGAARKQAIAKTLFEQHTRDRLALISTQVLQEFYAAAVRKIKLPADEAYNALVHLARLSMVEIGRAHILDAAVRSRQYSLSFWDALIIEAALAGGATTLLSEDMQHGQIIDGVKIENPFLPGL